MPRISQLWISAISIRLWGAVSGWPVFCVARFACVVCHRLYFLMVWASAHKFASCLNSACLVLRGYPVEYGAVSLYSTVWLACIGRCGKLARAPSWPTVQVTHFGEHFWDPQNAQDFSP